MLSDRVMQASGLASFVVLLSGTNAVAVEPMEGAELVASCQSYAAASGSGEGSLCRGYLQGLLASEATAAGAGQSALVTRATQTRASHLISRVETYTTTPAYCLPENTSVDTIIEHLVYDSQDSEFNALPAEAVVAATLARHFPCYTPR